MIDVKLSIEGYNHLYLYYLEGEDEYEEIHVKIRDNKIIFVEDYDSNVVIASVDLGTPEGKILSHYTECTLRIVANGAGEIFIHESCMNPNDPYLGRCYNCFLRGHQYGCKKEILKKIRKMDTTINDLRFIDPIQGRTRNLVKKIEEYEIVIKKLERDYSDISDEGVKKICETAHLLQCQLEELCNKWDYGTFSRWNYDDIEEDS